MSEQKSRGFVDLYEEPSEHEHEWQPRKYYYCECGEIAPSIQEMWERIKALEGAVELVNDLMPDQDAFLEYLIENEDIPIPGGGEYMDFVIEKTARLRHALKKLEEV